MQDQLTVNFVTSCFGQGLPTSIGPDKNGRMEVSSNYVFTTYASSASGEESGGSGGDKDPSIPNTA
jgi:hypothetical protein